MTDEQINLKFEVVADHLASLAVGLQGLQDEVRSLAQIQRSAEERWTRTEGSVRALLAAVEIQAEEIKELSESVKIVDQRQRETDDRLNILVDTVERYISERRNGKG